MSIDEVCRRNQPREILALIFLKDQGVKLASPRDGLCRKLRKPLLEDGLELAYPTIHGPRLSARASS